jgi:hypothetical protein
MTPYYQMGGADGLSVDLSNTAPNEPYMGIPGDLDFPGFTNSIMANALAGFGGGEGLSTGGLSGGLGWVTPQNPQGQWTDTGSYRSHMDISPLNSTNQININPALHPTRESWRWS